MVSARWSYPPGLETPSGSSPGYHSSKAWELALSRTSSSEAFSSTPIVWEGPFNDSEPRTLGLIGDAVGCEILVAILTEG
jgi:hypothetical protein